MTDQTHLGLDIEYAPSTIPLDLTHRVETGAIQVARELGVLDERPGFNELLKRASGYEKVLLPVCLARSWDSGRVWWRACQNNGERSSMFL
jgi:hypothetical protein